MGNCLKSIYLRRHEGTPAEPQLLISPSNDWNHKMNQLLVIEFIINLCSPRSYLWSSELIFQFVNFGVNVRSVRFIWIRL